MPILFVSRSVSLQVRLRGLNGLQVSSHGDHFFPRKQSSIFGSNRSDPHFQDLVQTLASHREVGCGPARSAKAIPPVHMKI